MHFLYSQNFVRKFLFKKSKEIVPKSFQNI